MCVTVICLLVVTIASRSLLPPLTLHIIARNYILSPVFRMPKPKHCLKLLGALCGSAISMDLAAQSMDPHSAQISMDCAEICGSRSRPYPGLDIDISRQWTIGPPVLEIWWSCQIVGGPDVANRQYLFVKSNTADIIYLFLLCTKHLNNTCNT